MADLYAELTGRVDANARRAVDIYLREVSEYRAVPDELATTMREFAVLIRRITLRRSAEHRPLADDDLAAIRAIGHQRGEHLLSLASQQHVLGLHTALLLREINEVATPAHGEDLLHLLGWLGQQGIRARGEYLDGHLTAVGESWSPPARVGLLTRMLLADEPVADGLWHQLGLQRAGHYLITVVRASPPELPGAERERVVADLLRRWRIPMGWTEPTELVILAPAGAATGTGAADVSDRTRDRTLALTREVAARLERAVAVGAAVGHIGGLAEPLALARSISEVAPRERLPHGLYSMTDRLVELSLAQVPHVDGWLRKIANQLEAGPDLIRTLDAYYRNDMSRGATAAALRIHARTLDYRLRRVYELTGLRPATTRGVRVLAAAVTRALASP